MQSMDEVLAADRGSPAAGRLEMARWKLTGEGTNRVMQILIRHRLGLLRPGNHDLDP